MFGFDLVFAMCAAVVICRAIWDETYCLITGKESARQARLRKRAEEGKPLLGDIATDWLNNAVNGNGSSPSGKKGLSPSRKFWTNWWTNFWDYQDQWWSDVWAEAKRRRREKHRQRVQGRINEERGSGGPTTTSAPADTTDTTPPSTPAEPRPTTGPDPTPPPPGVPGDPTEGDDEASGPRGRSEDWVPPPPAEAPRQPIRATAVVIRPEPIPPRTLPPADRPALPASGQAPTSSEQNGSTPMAPTTLVSASNAVTRMANDDTDPEATILLGHDLEKLAVYMSDLFDARAEDLATVGVGGATQEILCQIQDDFDNLITLAKKLAVRGNRHADLADHAEEVGDVDAGTYLNRGRKVPRQLRKRAALTGR